MLMHMTHSRETNSHPFSSPSGGREDQIHVPGSNLLRPLRSFVCHETESRYPSVNPGSGLKEFITHWKLDGSSPVLKPRRISRHLNMEDSCLVDSSETVRKSLRLMTLVGYNSTPTATEQVQRIIFPRSLPPPTPLRTSDTSSTVLKLWGHA